MTVRIILFIFLISQSVFGWQTSGDFTSSNLPIVIINTNDQDIPYDDPRIIAEMQIIYQENGERNLVSDSANNYSGNISLEIRGESSATWDIKSYGFETQNEDGSNRNVSLLGLPEDNDWVLHAPYFDRSLLRNVLSYHLSREMGWYASRTVYCEVILNDEYQGIYVLMEKIKKDKNRVDIATLSPEEISGDDVTGGYILRVDKEGWSSGIDSSFPTTEHSNVIIRYQYYYPKADEITPEQEEYIGGFIQDFEELMHDGDYTDPINGYSKYLNVDSFVDYLILNELSRNVDGYRLSSYLTKQKDSDGGKLIAGPAWDYNFSYGNAGYYEAERTEGWQLLYFNDDQNFLRNDNFQVPFWWKILFNDGDFTKRLNQRWFQLRQGILSSDSLNNTIDGFADITTEARTRNFEVRPAPGSNNLGGGWFPYDPRNNQIQSYEDELTLTKNWIVERANWIDSNIGLLTANANEDKSKVQGFKLMQNYPNPFNPTTQIAFEIPTASHVALSIYNVQGQAILELVNRTLNSGRHQVDVNASQLSSGVYFYRLTVEDFQQTRKMMLIK